MPDTPRKIIRAMVDGLRQYLNLTEVQCYESIAEAYIEGQPPLVVQVVPRNINLDSAGDGAQQGGNLERRMSVTLCVWYRLKLDRHGHGEMMLTEAFNGMLAFCERVRSLFSVTTLGGVVLEPVRYDGESATSWYDADSGVVRRDMNFTCAWAEELPRRITL